MGHDAHERVDAGFWCGGGGAPGVPVVGAAVVSVVGVEGSREHLVVALSRERGGFGA